MFYSILLARFYRPVSSYTFIPLRILFTFTLLCCRKLPLKLYFISIPLILFVLTVMLFVFDISARRFGSASAVSQCALGINLTWLDLRGAVKKISSWLIRCHCCYYHFSMPFYLFLFREHTECQVFEGRRGGGKRKKNPRTGCNSSANRFHQHRLI